MKVSYKVLVLFLGLCLIPLCAGAIKSIVSGDADNAGDKKVKTYSNNFPYQASTPINIHADGFSLVADSGSLLHDLDISVAFIPYKGGTPLPSDMENVTGVCEGVRLLPNGEHFSETNLARITLSYNPERIPMGYEPNEIYTYYCDDASHWHRLARVEVDTVAHTVTSLTTHFTDFANAVIKVPEMPESKAFVPTMMTDLPDPDPMKGIPMIAAPTPNNRGTAELTYPIELPKGRNGLQPNIDLHYSSANAGSNGILGPGWSINFPAITIDTRWGVPRFAPGYESEQYLVNGEPVLFKNEDGITVSYLTDDPLISPRMKNSVQLYARDTKNADRIIRHGDNPKKYWWEVTDRNGVTTYYGRKFDPGNPNDDAIDENSVVRTDDNFITYWAATAMVDVYGNYIQYTNKKDGNCIYVNQIDYTGNHIQKVSPKYSIRFEHSRYNDISSFCRLGVLQSKEQKIDKITIHHRQYQDSLILSSYSLNYSKPEEKNLFKCRLHSIIKDGESDYITTFSYADAPILEKLFSAPDFIVIPDSRNISESKTKSWGLGGTATVGVGPDVMTTWLSLGGNYNYSKSNGSCISLLMDINGDGLKDIVYKDEKEGGIYYCRQVMQDGKCSFLNAERVKGLSRLSHETTVTHTWGLQLSFGADLSYSNPISKSVMDAYFTDVNADGLPDFVDGIKVKICHLNEEGNPYYEEALPGQKIAVHNSKSCSYDNGSSESGTNSSEDNRENSNGIIFDGEVDEHIDCELREIPLGKVSLDEYEYIIEDLPYFQPRKMYPGEVLSKEESKAYDLYQQWGWLVRQNRQLDPKCRFQAVGDSVYLYELEAICDTTRIDPGIENVRVWVAPSDGTISLTETIALLQDDSKSRLVSHNADGVSYTIQHCSNVTELGDKHLHAVYSEILHEGTIDADDYTEHLWSKSVTVKAGDIIMFRLRSRENNRFDKTKWHHQIQYDNKSQIYDSEKDFVCTGDGHFSAYNKGKVELTFSGSNNGTTPVLLTVRKNQQSFTDTLTVGKVNILLQEYDVEANDSIFISLGKIGDNEPCWGDVHVLPCLQYISDFPIDDMGNTTHDTVTYYPDVQILDPSFSLYPNADSPYRQLFGALHKGWGQFAYQNIGNQDIIPLDYLVNTQRVAAEQLRGINIEQDTSAFRDKVRTFSPSADGNLEEQINTAFSNDTLYNIRYNPIAKNNYWIPMYADNRTEQYIAYGNLGCIGRSIHSNDREISNAEEISSSSAKSAIGEFESNSTDEIIEYDSPLPYLPGQVRNQHVFKCSSSKQHSIAYGPLVFNHSNSWGSYENIVDYMDLNGDGFPDVLGKGGIQYTQPWGEIGQLEIVKNYTPFNGKTEAKGHAFSGCPIQMEGTMSNSEQNGKWHLKATMGISGGIGSSSVRTQYVDMNGDGLVDKFDIDQHKVFYNIGYQFSNPIDYGFNVLEGSYTSSRISADLSGGVSFPVSAYSVAQVSISGGVAGDLSTNMTNEQLVDINGDGILDRISQSIFDGKIHVQYNGNGRQIKELPIDVPSLEKTKNLTTTVGLTGGFSWMIVKVNVGFQSTPYSISISHGEAMLTDMNGDGLVDYVQKKDKSNYLSVQYNQAGKANLLDIVTNPTGQQIVLDYTLSEPTSAHMSRQWNMSRVENLAPNHPMPEMRKSTMEIKYAEPYYDNYERTDYGYKYVTATENNEKVYRSVYNNQSYLQHGELIANSIMDKDGNLYVSHKHEVTYKNEDGEQTCNDMDMIVEEEDEYWTYYYEGESEPQITTHYTIKYDKYHNITEYADFGEDGTSDDNWRQEITYVPNAANNMVSLPKTEKVYDGTGKLLRSSSVKYSNLGKPTDISFQVNEEEKNVATTNLEYDKLGNVTKIIAPKDANDERNWSKFEYDTVTYSYVTSIDNPLHAITKTEYDYRWGLPTKVTDPAGNEIRYTYDNNGRLDTVLAPNELAQRKTYTISYEYGNTDYGMVVQKHAPSAYLDEASLFDQYGNLMQKKHYTEVYGENQWVVDKAEEWDKYGRPVSSGFPFVARKSETEYEPFKNAEAIVATEYDFMDRPTKQTNADRTNKRIDYDFKADTAGVLRLATSVTDENGITTTTLKSPQDWTIQQIAGDGNKTNFTYSPIGELRSSTDADGYTTTYEYDMLGRTISCIHPDAGETDYVYDPAGNLISKATANGEVQYIYEYNRLKEIRYPYNTENNVSYEYDEAGRIAKRTDGTGSEEFLYDEMGNLAQSLRRIVVPTEEYAYLFRTQYKYDSFGRMRSMTYPDGEEVGYEYTTGGLLKAVLGNNKYIHEIEYDAQGRKTYQWFGNGVETWYSYDRKRQWLTNISSESPSDGDGDRYLAFPSGTFQNLRYTYDKVGNIVSTSNRVFGRTGSSTYEYDNQYRLVGSESNYTRRYCYPLRGCVDEDCIECDDKKYSHIFSATYSPSGRMGNKYSSSTSMSNLSFGYDQDHVTHQPRTMYDPQVGTMDLFWDLNGNLAQVLNSERNSARLHEWDEENRLKFVLGEKYAGYYGYDGNGDRVYKLTGTSSLDRRNSGITKATAFFDNAVLYPNPYMVVTKKGYTKHYYAGSERIAAVIGNGGFEDMKYPFDELGADNDLAIVKSFDKYQDNDDPFHVGYLPYGMNVEDVNGETDSKLAYHSEPLFIDSVEIQYQPGMLGEAVSNNTGKNGSEEKNVYFYHPDHLGSASWITDRNADIVAEYQYAPYGELIYSQQSGYDERYKFTGKERDGETGYDYFGARYFWSALGHWLSVDPLADKYPGISPYAYCAWNPIKYVDPDGRELVVSFCTDANKLPYHYKDNLHLKYYAKKHYSNSSPIIHFWAHGAPNHIRLEDFTVISTPQRMYEYLNEHSKEFKTNSATGNPSVLVLHSCSTGSGENSFAQQLSADEHFSNTLVIAPSSVLNVGTKETIENSGSWIAFYKGNQVGAINAYDTPWFKFWGEQKEAVRLEDLFKNMTTEQVFKYFNVDVDK